MPPPPRIGRPTTATRRATKEEARPASLAIRGAGAIRPSTSRIGRCISNGNGRANVGRNSTPTCGASLISTTQAEAEEEKVAALAADVRGNEGSIAPGSRYLPLEAGIAARPLKAPIFS